MGGPKRVILHVGMLKTGTTSLQAFLRENEEELAAQGIGYYIPKHIEADTYQNAGFLCWSSLHEAQGTVSENSSLNDEERALFSEFTKGYDTLILSKEYMSELGVKLPTYWDVVKKHIFELVGENTQIDVIIFLRRQDDWVFSRWKQAVYEFFLRDRATPISIPNFSKYLNMVKSSGLMDYDKSLERLIRVFGRDYVTVCGYDGNQDGAFDTVNTFLVATNISLPDADRNEVMRKNTSITMRAAEALLLIGQSENIKGISSKDIRRAAKAFSRLYPEEQKIYPLGKYERERLLTEFEESNERVSMEYNKGIPLFAPEIEDYCVWHEDPVQAKQDAETIVKLASVSRETTAFLIKEARKS